MLPHGSSDILRYDCHSNILEKKKFGKEKIRAAKCYETDGTRIYAVDYDSNKLLRCDFSDRSCSVIKIGTGDAGYWGIKRRTDILYCYAYLKEKLYCGMKRPEKCLNL